MSGLHQLQQVFLLLVLYNIDRRTRDNTQPDPAVHVYYHALSPLAGHTALACP